MFANFAEHTRIRRYWSVAHRYVRPGPAHLLMYTAGRFSTVRKVGAAISRRRSRAATDVAPQEQTSFLEKVNVDEIVARLERDGICGGLCLRPETLNELKSFYDTAPCFGNGLRSQPFLIAQKQAAEDQYGTAFSAGRYLDCWKTCATIRNLLQDPTLISIARGYLGAEPVLITARMWWSFSADTDSSEQVANGQAFHYDLDDYRAICFFFYLTDVDEQSGAHQCVLGSHRSKPLRFLLSPFKQRSDASIEAAYGRERITSIFGASGEGFAEDIFCYHKGLPPRSGDRLLLQIRYRLRKYGEAGPDE